MGVSNKNYDVIIIGGGQSALACAYFLRRTGLSYILLDEQDEPGGAWQHGWESLTLFSPAAFSSLPGWLMPESSGKFPSRAEAIAYLKAYEEKYKIPAERPVKVKKVAKIDNGYTLSTSNGAYFCKALISGTGTWGSPFVPNLEGLGSFKGKQLHSAHYTNAKDFQGKKVLVVGGGNSGAQLLAEISKVANTVWSTLTLPTFLPDEVDGRVLFDVATAKYQAMKEGKPLDTKQYDLANIVMVPSVVEARERDVLHSKGRFIAFTETGVIWESNEREDFDIIVWCTGFKYATKHLNELGITGVDGRVVTEGTRAKEVAGLWLVGYGNWTGFASATLIGVGRSARATVNELNEYLNH
ncbi:MULTISPECIES: ArsO family NAD(P)H-dependent flavin-containing monooxygenase [Olivibacter]|uniref:ArsO family NAD(P)H-dependent flavin-containing monooxygenase n=1 Tax=Olivibacter oleidegradans TaxID=760123 RepID=A0ABV6HQI3_9SPHI|nr:MULTISPECIES: ArsO family NAD(P)H-dependent flavin-containing monooxygenase [Olivibacter]QEL03892.1 NAD(P)/FAD-dependent oxidoreductase [Olivibacter sp. LS-1]